MLEPFFVRRRFADGCFSYGQFMSVFSKTVAERTRPGQRQDVEEKGSFST